MDALSFLRCSKASASIYSNRSFHWAVESAKSHLVWSHLIPLPSCGLESLPGGFQASDFKLRSKNEKFNKKPTEHDVFNGLLMKIISGWLVSSPKHFGRLCAAKCLGILVPGVHDQLQQVQPLTTCFGLSDNREYCVFGLSDNREYCFVTTCFGLFRICA